MKPWFRFYTDAHRHAKIDALPNDTARWGWVVLLCRSKEQDGGEFVSERQLRESVGTYAKYIPDWRRVGLLDKLTVHDFEQLQSSADPSNAERQRKFREKHNGESNAGNALRNGKKTARVTVHRRET